MSETVHPPHTSTQWFGHPRGLATLYFTEMWERFSYYGMRALLMLYMTDTMRRGMGLGVAKAAAIYGLYTFGVYALALPGGWLADRLLGKKRTVLWGGIVIALGHYLLAIHSDVTFFIGLGVVMIGTGLLKPNVSAVVGDLYPEGGARRDAGFSIYYSGINLGAFLGQIICPLLGEKVDWHLGFGAAAIGMTLGIIQYLHGQKHLVGAGDPPLEVRDPQKRSLVVRQALGGVGVVAAVAAGLWLLNNVGIMPLTVESFASYTGVVVAVLVVLYFTYVIAFVCRDRVERGRIAVCAALFLGAAIFWSGFEQAGSSMSLFARDFTDRVVLGYEIPAGSVQNFNSIFVILLAPVVGMLWLKLGARNPSIPVKFALGLLLLGSGFFVLSWGSTYVDEGQVGMRWLIVTYFFHTLGELCLSPVGLSSTTKLAPERLVGQMMGTWFMGAAVGNLFAGLAAGRIESLPLPNLFATVALTGIAGGVLFLVFTPVLNRLAGGIR